MNTIITIIITVICAACAAACACSKVYTAMIFVVTAQIANQSSAMFRCKIPIDLLDWK